MDTAVSVPDPVIQHITLNHRHPAVTIDDLALMLEIDSMLGHKEDFRQRLRRALSDAFRQGSTVLNRSEP